MAFWCSSQELKNDTTSSDYRKIVIRLPQSGSQELKNDTIKLGYHNLIIRLPESSIVGAAYDRYEEGFFKYYLLKDSMYIVVHHGALATMAMPQPDSVVYNCKLGNVAKSLLFIRNGLYFRRDNYHIYGTALMFYNAPEEDSKQANEIFDNVRFERVRR